MIRIDEIYNNTFWPWLNQHCTGTRMFFCDPPGHTGPEHLFNLGRDDVVETDYVFFHDQEPVHLDAFEQLFDEVNTRNLDLWRYDGRPVLPSPIGHVVVSERGEYVEELTKKYGDHVVFQDASLTIQRGEKLAFVGKNGEGKSTMIKAIMKEINFEGSLELGHNVQIGYFAQNQASLLDEELSIFETIDNIAVGDIRTKIEDILGAFMFGGEISAKKVKVLSGGEKTRLAMIKLLLQPVNLLILDEPTNHLDMKTKDIIKDALRDFDGTLILVSHDRDFLDGLATKVFEFGNKRVKEHFEDIKGFMAKKKIEHMREFEK
jgi:ABC-type multidrug transport system ATPase subunit